jgi:hypothetical protein
MMHYLKDPDFEKVANIVDQISMNDLEHLTRLSEYTIECNSVFLQTVFKLLESFFSNSPDENIVLIVRSMDT